MSSKNIKPKCINFILYYFKVMKINHQKKTNILSKKTKSKENRALKYTKAHNSNFYKKAYLCKIKLKPKNIISVIKVKKKKNKILKVLIFQNL
jgi:hypothetical protein